MAEWKGMTIDESFIRTKTDRSVLFKMPRYGEYDGFTFWHPKKLVQTGFGLAEIRYTDDFQFRLQKREKNHSGQWETTDEATLTPEELQAAYSEEEPLIYTPKPLEPEHATADESLIDDE